MKDFVQHRLALERAWQDTIPYNSEDTEPTDPGYMDDLWSDIVRFCTLVYAWFILYLIFTR